MMRHVVAKFGAIAIACTISLAAQAVAESRARLEIPAGELISALKSLAAQLDIELVYQPEQLRNMRTDGVQGTYSAQKALAILIRGTALEVHTDISGAMVIAPPTAAKVPAQPSANTAAPSKSFWSRLRLAQADTPSTAQVDAQNPSPAKGEGRGEDEKEAQSPKRIELEEILVTGTLIRDVMPVGSSLKVYSREEIQRSGAATLEQFARRMTENFSDTDLVSNKDSTAATFGGFSSSLNMYGASAFNLRGLGPGATLTLVNGSRLAPAGFRGGLTDISQIPLSAVERIEVLTDGSSALYGADAVAGVVNIIMRNDFEGAETGLRYGDSAEGGGSQITASQMFGTSWTGGNAVFSYQHSHQDTLDASERGYLPDQGGPYSLIPESRINSVFVSASQALDEHGRLFGHALWGERKTDTHAFRVNDFYELDSSDHNEVIDRSVALGYEHELSGEWLAKLIGNYSRIRQTSSGQSFFTPAGGTGDLSLVDLWTDSELFGADLLVNGTVLRRSTGSLKAAFGGGYRRDTFQNLSQTTVSSGVFPTLLPKLDRSARSLFAELRVSAFEGGSGAGPLEISAAGRYDDYSDFGSSTNYKLALGWSPYFGVRLRATYGTSFKAPALAELGTATRYGIILSNPDGAGGFVNLIQISGRDPDLDAEQSESFTAGMDFEPEFAPGLKLGVTYYGIDFTDKIGTPSITGNLLTNPIAVPFVTRNPPLPDVQAIFATPGFQNRGLTPADIGAIYDGRLTNLASTRQSGVDFTALYTVPTRYGEFGFTLSAERLLKNETQSIEGQPAIDYLNVFAQPPKWRERGSVSWTRNAVSASVTLNNVNSYRNGLGATPTDPGSNQSIDAWTTVDLNLSYRIATSNTLPLLSGTTFALFAGNLLDEEPPFVEVPLALLLPGEQMLPFDAANASPVGRFMSLQVLKRW